MLMRAVHPGDVLEDEIDAHGITAAELARQIDVPANRISQILAGKRGISGDTALRLGHWFGTEPEFWMALQAQYDLARAAETMGDAIDHLPTRGQSVSPDA